MKGKYALLSILVLVLACGNKYPLPPENPGSLPSEEDYIPVRNTSWDNQRFNEVQDLIVGKDGYIYVLEKGTLFRLNVNGDLVDTFFNGFKEAKAIAQDLSRNIYIADSSKILVFTRDKVLLYEIDFSDTINPSGLDVDSYKNLYISDSYRSFVVKTDSVGNFIEFIALEGSGILNVNNPGGIFVDEKYRRIVIASTGNNWVEALTLASPRGSALHLGGFTHEGGDTAGVFTRPTDVWVDTLGFIYVLDYGNKRIQKFNNDGGVVQIEDFDEFPVSLSTSRDGMYLYAAFPDKVIKMKKPDLPQNPGGQQ